MSFSIPSVTTAFTVSGLPTAGLISALLRHCTGRWCFVYRCGVERGICPVSLHQGFPFSISFSCPRHRSKSTITATHKQTFIQTRFVTPNSCPYRQNFVRFLLSNFRPHPIIPFTLERWRYIFLIIAPLVIKSTTLISETILEISLLMAGVDLEMYILFRFWLRWMGFCVLVLLLLSRSPFCWIQMRG